MKTKKIDVSQVIKKITDLGGHVVLKQSEESDLETLTPEKAKKLQILCNLPQKQDHLKI